MKALEQIIALAVAATALGACAADVDEPWFLDHDRIVAVRATPPHIASGERSVLDALIGTKGAPTHEATPDLAYVVSPESFTDILAPGAEGWVVTAPDEARLAAARTALDLDADAPVPVQIGVSYAGNTLFALKTVYLGDSVANPTLEGLTIDDAPAPEGAVEMARDVEVRLAVEADAELVKVNWLTSTGTMHDFDLPSAYVVIEEEDPSSGELAIVLRDRSGGVVWRVWTLTAP
ncbi:MAG TPA: hypothetical protein VM261_32500 [Kofleriaceae bacterium]|nr:hypothetical protein [Kofleriaceae bacterium]